MNQDDRLFRIVGAIAMIAGGVLFVGFGALTLMLLWAAARSSGSPDLGTVIFGLTGVLAALPAGLGALGIALGYFVFRGGGARRLAAGLLGALWLCVSLAVPEFVPFRLVPTLFALALGTAAVGLAAGGDGARGRVRASWAMAACILAVLALEGHTALRQHQARASQMAEQRASAEQEASQRARLNSLVDSCDHADELSTFCGQLYAVAISDDARRIATAGISGRQTRVILWDREAGRALWQMETTWSDDQTVAFSPDGDVVYGTRERAFILARGDGKTSRELTYCGGPMVRPEIYFPPDTGFAILRSQSGESCEYDAHTWQLIRRLSMSAVPTSHPKKTARMRWWDDRVGVWDLSTGEKIWAAPFHGPVTFVRLSPDGSRVFGFYQDGTLRVWDTARFVMLGESHQQYLFGLVPIDARYVVGIAAHSTPVIDTESGSTVRDLVVDNPGVSVAVARKAPFAAIAFKYGLRNNKVVNTLRVRPIAELIDPNGAPER